MEFLLLRINNSLLRSIRVNKEIQVKKVKGKKLRVKNQKKRKRNQNQKKRKKNQYQNLKKNQNFSLVK